MHMRTAHLERGADSRPRWVRRCTGVVHAHGAAHDAPVGERHPAPQRAHVSRCDGPHTAEPQVIHARLLAKSAHEPDALKRRPVQLPLTLVAAPRSRDAQRFAHCTVKSNGRPIREMHMRIASSYAMIRRSTARGAKASSTSPRAAACAPVPTCAAVVIRHTHTAVYENAYLHARRCARSTARRRAPPRAAHFGYAYDRIRECISLCAPVRT